MLLITTTALLLATQFVEGPAASSQGCVSAITGQQTTIVASNVGTFRNGPSQLPKQGDVFTVYINVAAFPQPCATHLTVRPGFKLPAGLELVPPGGFGSPIVRCLLGANGSGVAQPCMLNPTEVLPDGTVIFDAPTTVNGGLWRIPHGQTLQIQVPVRGRQQLAATLQGHVDFVAFDAIRPALRPSVGVDVFFFPPSIAAPTPAVSPVLSYSAHVFGYVDPHYNAGVLGLELSRAGGPFEVVDSTFLDDSQFEADVDLVVENLEPNTDYQFRWSYTVGGVGTPFRGPATSFRTLPPPRFPVTTSVSGNGTIEANVELLSDGTYFDRTQVTFNAVASPGHRVVSLTVNGAPVIGTAAYVTISGVTAVHATFEALPVAAPPVEDAPADDTEDAPADAPAAEDTPAEDAAADDTEDAPADAPAAEDAEDAPEADDTEDGADAPTGPGNDAGSDINVQAPAFGAERDDSDDSDDSDDDEEAGCAATAPAAFPLGFVALVFARRRRR